MKPTAFMLLFCLPIAMIFAQGRTGGSRSGDQPSVRDTHSREIGNTRSAQQQETPPRQKPVETIQPSPPSPGNNNPDPPSHERPEPCPPAPLPYVEPVQTPTPWPIPNPGPSGFCILNGIRYGENVTLGDSYDMPDYSGYDFSRYTKLPFDDPSTDVFVESDNGELLIRVRDDTEIMDIGKISIAKNAIFIPRKEWSTPHEEPLTIDHEYVIRTWDHHFAKIKVASVGEHRVVFDWAYQEDSPGNEYNGMTRSIGTVGFTR